MPYLTAAEVRTKARSASLADEQVFSDEDIEDLIEEFEDIAERYCGVAFITRTSTTVSTLARGTLVILKPKIIAVSALTIDDEASTNYEALNDVAKAAGYLTMSSCTTGDVSVTYTHGYATTPKGILRACVQYVRASALRDDSNQTRDVVSQGSVDLGTTRYATPDWDDDRPTGYITVDAALNVQGRAAPGIY